jgi:hypothetical protein
LAFCQQYHEELDFIKRLVVHPTYYPYYFQLEDHWLANRGRVCPVIRGHLQ